MEERVHDFTGRELELPICGPTVLLSARSPLYPCSPVTQGSGCPIQNGMLCPCID
ncbi:hypothetical protein I79_013602 [Cricetulus griseus]|uniref:Uncharacterized protein n=1 Tax=Cricetulus griseus TaxID=10029 RepID=G3HRX7_CRIGR|nr:hypothetical protein I79_013602 [Cricetulus griseus]